METDKSYKENIVWCSMIKTTTIPRERWGVHENHCCPIHGCKYGDADCPVVLKLIPSNHRCESCDDEKREITTWGYFCPWCHKDNPDNKKELEWDQFKEMWRCREHGLFDTPEVIKKSVVKTQYEVDTGMKYRGVCSCHPGDVKCSDLHPLRKVESCATCRHCDYNVTNTCNLFKRTCADYASICDAHERKPHGE